MRYLSFIMFLLWAPLVQAAEELTLPTESAKQLYSLDSDLIYRINFGSDEDIRVLLEKGAHVNARSPQGDTALTLALVRNDPTGVKMAKVLLEKGADPNLQDANRNYPIVLAIRYGREDLVSLLLDKGADFHIRDVSGTSLQDIAKQNGNPTMIKLVQDLVDKENNYAASMRSSERFNEIIRRYSFYSCYYQYWSYYLSSRQDPDQNDATSKKIEDSKLALSKLLGQIQQYYPSTTSTQLQSVADGSAKLVSKQLDDLISNYNRGLNGVGRDDDANHRCQAIADSTKPTFVPTDIRRIN
jgi:hypothetical protein